MPNKNIDILFQLISSLEKSEKRNFKLYIKRNSTNHDLKIVQLFDALDKMNEYDEKILFKKLSTVEKPQLANLKVHLHKQILASLRVLKSTESIDLQLNEQLDYARILYNKGLYLQSLKFLDKAREMARSHNKFNFLTQVLSLEKKIETLYITRSMYDKAHQLSEESIEVTERISMVARLSNLSLELYSWYIKNGHAKNVDEETEVKYFLKKNMPANAQNQTGFYEKLYLFQSLNWEAFIRQDFLMYYRYSQKWINLFDENPSMIPVEAGHYIKGLHNLLNAHFDLRNYKKFSQTLAKFEAFAETPFANHHDNFRIHNFVYINSAKLNWNLMTGSFKEGAEMVPFIESKLKEYELYIDNHRILVLNYKFAILFFGIGNYEKCIDYLQKIINGQTDLRIDLQCYSRLLHLMAHYEMGTTDILEYLSKSVYRFMARMQNLSAVEEGIFKFLKSTFKLGRHRLKPELENFLATVKQFEKDRFETRALAYLDVISWAESKLENKTMGKIINEKYIASKHK